MVLIRALAGCTFIDQRPDYASSDTFANGRGGQSGGGGGGMWLPSAVEVYHKLLVPVLKLIVSVLITLPRHVDVAGQVLDFIDAHSELIAMIVTEHTPDVVRDFHLEEVQLVTGMYYHLFAFRSLEIQQLERRQRRGRTGHSGGLVRETQAMLLGLLKKYCNGERWMFKNHERYDDSTREKVQEICCNLIAYARRLCIDPFVAEATTASVPMKSSASSSPAQLFKLIFTPHFAMKPGMDSSVMISPIGLSQRSHETNPPLMLLADYMNFSLERFDLVFGELRAAKRQTTNRGGLTGESVLKLLGQDDAKVDADMTRLHQPQSSATKRAQIRAKLDEKIAAKSKELDSILFVVENCLVILWKHLERFLSRSVEKDAQFAITSQSKLDVLRRDATKALRVALLKISSPQFKPYTSAELFSITVKLKELLHL
eukprot:TRINITY_DN8475_c0_g2_i1.p1 TRINITY_DN8475_c0_g2~~TRINITY_DN8475_c0_g2_i1.p1  ORF type:complete len:429 (-),score=63.99 TRINITY_DN8475_c0_g2_i1:110-1396(-)